MGQKYFCDIEGNEDIFIEVTDAWTVKEMRALADSEEKEYFEIFQKKVEAMHLRDVSGNVFTNPKDFNLDILENFDVAVAGFIGSILPIHVRKRRNLGGMKVRQSSPTNDGQSFQTPK
jgi:hypothetical protein